MALARRRVGLPALALAALATLAARAAWAQEELGRLPRLQDYSQSFEVHPDSGRFTVGDTVGLRFRLRLDDRDLLFDTVPRPIEPAEGVRVIRVERLRRDPKRIFEGRATLAFYRPGRQMVPIFGLPFMRAVKGLGRGVVASDTAWVEVAAVLPPGGPALKDIRDIERVPGPGPWPFVAGLAALAALTLGLRARRWRRAAAPAPEVAVAAEPAPAAPDAYELALSRLAEIEARGWPARGEIARHYQAAADALRDYLEAAEGIPARERTTSELVWELPPRLGEDGLRDRCRLVLGEADLVKFARARPDASAAAAFLAAVRDLLGRWHQLRRDPRSAEAGELMEEEAGALR